MNDPNASDRLQEIRDHIKGRGEWRAEVVEGINYATGAEPLGLRIFTRGRVGASNRWRKEFVIWAQEHQTLSDVAHIVGIGARP